MSKKGLNPMGKDFIVNGEELSKYELIDLAINSTATLNVPFVELIRSAIIELGKHGYQVEYIKEDMIF